MQRTLLLGASGLALLMPLAAHAQTAAVNTPAAAQASDATALGEVVVTAERRESSVRQVGFSLFAVSGETLRKQEVHGAASLVTLVPGVTLNNSDKSISVVEIRGSVSTFRTATLDAPIGFFVDDVYYPYSTDLNSNFFDVQHAEVLRGPQGTLFGRNVTGGAIVIATNNPKFDEDWLLQASAGNYGYVRTEGMLNGVLVPGQLAGRLAFTTERVEGMFDRPNVRTKGGSGDSGSVRGKLLYTPSDDLQVILSADYSSYQGDGSSTQYVPARKDGGPPAIPPYFLSQGAFSLSKYTNSTSYFEPNGVRQSGVAGHADYSMFGGTLTSISSYRGTSSNSFMNTTPFAGPAGIPYDNHVNNRWFTQEVRFASAPGRFSYVVGGYYLNGRYDTETFLGHQPAPGSALFCFYNFATPANGCAPGASSTTNPTGRITVDRNQHGHVESIAGFGEATFKITDQLSVTAGGRYTSDTKHLDMKATSPDLDPFGYTQPQVAGYFGPLHATAKKTWNAFTPRVIIKFVPNDQLNTYVTYSEGFKSGGWVDQNYTVAGATLPLAPEHAKNLEAGVKTRLFDNRLSANLSVFHQTTSNLQNFSGAGGTPHSYNGESRVNGAELETTARVTDALTLSFNYAYLDAIYTKLIDPATITAANPKGVDFSGNPLKYTPKNSFTASGQYVFNLPNEATLTLQADYEYSDRYSTQDSAQNLLYPTIYNKTAARNLNARLSYQTQDGRFSAQLWAKNITNYYRYDYADDSSVFSPTTPGVTFWRVVGNTPRTVGVTVTLRH